MNYFAKVMRLIVVVSVILHPIICWASPINAKENEFLDMDITQLMQITITSVSKKEQSLSDAAAAIYVITQEDIRRSGVSSIPEALRLAPGVQVNEFDISLYTVHLGAKYRGMNLTGEYFFRWLTSISGTGPLPVSSLFDHGFMVNVGAFVVPRKFY